METDIEALMSGIRFLSLKMKRLRELHRAESELANLGTRQLELLEQIAKNREMTPSDIQKYFPRTAPSTISADIALLENKGWIVRRLAVKDKRVHLVALTETGLEIAAENATHQEMTYGPLVKGLRRSKEHVRAVMDVVARVNDELDQELASLEGQDSD